MSKTHKLKITKRKIGGILAGIVVLVFGLVFLVASNGHSVLGWIFIGIAFLFIFTKEVTELHFKKMTVSYYFQTLFLPNFRRTTSMAGSTRLVARDIYRHSSAPTSEPLEYIEICIFNDQDDKIRLALHGSTRKALKTLRKIQAASGWPFEDWTRNQECKL